MSQTNETQLTEAPAPWAQRRRALREAKKKFPDPRRPAKLTA
jgi:hypothetical protein